MSNDRSARRDPPPSAGKVALEILRLKPNWCRVVRTLSYLYKGILTHYYQGRSRYCPPNEDCSLHYLPAVWKGYACVEEYHQTGNLWIPRVLEISESMDQDLHGRFDRGQVWEVRCGKQEGKHHHPRHTAKFLEERDIFSFPEPYPMDVPLQLLYHVPQVILNVDNPQPRRVYVPVSPVVKALAENLTPPDPPNARPARFQDVWLQKKGIARVQAHGNGKHPEGGHLDGNPPLSDPPTP